MTKLTPIEALLEALNEHVGQLVFVKTKLKNNKDIILTGKLVRTRGSYGRAEGLVEFLAPNKNSEWFTTQKIQKT